MTSEGSDAYLNDILDMSESADLNNKKSEIAEFFAHTNILVTGGTGFLGKLLVEKLLRSCPDITTLYLLVRPKKGKSSLERVKENFDDVVYNRLKREQPNFLSKVILLEGDATKDELGLSAENKKMLMNTNIIFHAAALVRFEEKLRLETNVNVKTVKFLLLFAKQLPDFKAFVHVSTAYAHCTRKCIEEKHYHDTIEADQLLTLLDILDDEKIERITPVLLDKWPNTYVFTKAVAENAVLKYSNGLPCCIVRPSIVISTFSEPLTAWTNNLYGATGVVMGSGIGLLRTLHCRSDYVADIIPADYVVSNIISAAWDVGTRKLSIKPDQDSNISDDERVPIYNSISSCQNPICWGDFMKKNEIYGFEIPSKKIFWYYMLILNRYLFLHNLCSLLFHTIPAVIVDTLAYITGRKPMLLAAYRKIHKFSKVISYFSTNEWQFQNDNVMNLWERMSSVDRQIFNFNTKYIDWDEYFYLHVRGLRVYMLNDSLDTVEESRYNYKKYRVAHYSIIILLSLLALWIIVSVISFLWSLCPLSH